MIPHADTIMNIPIAPYSICNFPFSLAVASSPFTIISTTPKAKTNIPIAKSIWIIGLTTFAIIGSITLPKVTAFTSA